MPGSGVCFQPSCKLALTPPACSSRGAILLVALLSHCNGSVFVYGQISFAEKSGLGLIPLLRG